MKEKKGGKGKDLNYYISYSKQLKKSNRDLERRLEILKQGVGTERERLEGDINSLRNEIDRLREPPLVVAVVVKIDEDARNVIVLSSTGPMFVVRPSWKVKNQNLEPGMFVSLNQRTFAIMRILSITKEDIKDARSRIFYD